MSLGHNSKLYRKKKEVGMTEVVPWTDGSTKIK